ncbi:MAG: glycosyltransferase family 4 protein [bacterium]
MKVLHISSNDVLGGAAKACLALDRSLNNSGITSSVLVQKKVGNQLNVNSISHSIYKKYSARFREGIEFFYNKYFVNEKYGRFSPAFIGADLSRESVLKDADIIHLHWINEGFLSPNTFNYLFKLRKPIIWTLHDMWAITGGCHYNGNCPNYLNECSICPALKISGRNDVSAKAFRKKQILFDTMDLNIVTCSNWLAGEAKRSIILFNKKVQAIPNTVDVEKFFKIDKNIAREKLQLSNEKIYLLFASMTAKDERKGFRYFLEALNYLYDEYSQLRSTLEILLIGRMEENMLCEFKFPVISFGRINDDEKLNYIYNSAEVFVAPSLQDNLPNTIMESLVCGVPSVAFNIGGIPDMIEHFYNGYLAENISGKCLADGIFWCVSDTERREFLSINSRKKFLNYFAPKIIAEKYINLYRSVI